MQDKYFYSICFLLIFIFGVFKVSFLPVSAPEIFEDQVGEKVYFVGEVVDEPEDREDNQKLIVEIKSEEDLKDNTKILITTFLGQDFKYGDEVSVLGKLEKPENFITDTGKEFDYINYLKKDGIFYVIRYAEVKLISNGNGNKIKSILFSVKEKFLEKINFAIPEPESLLMGGLILGEKESFGQEERQKFIDTGTIHIIALSGYNITIVAEWIMKFFSFLPQVFGIYLGIFSIFLFVLMTGGASTAIRAGIMATLALVARATGRNYDIGRALLLAATLMIMINPMILLYDVSFQLSFIATIAVVYLSPRIEKYFFWVTKSFGLRDIFSVTCAAYIFVLPFILYKMGNLSLVALPANFLILPFIPFTMGFGFLTGLFGLISNFLSLPFGFIAYFLLHYELGVINILSGLPFASFFISNFPLVLTILIYVYFVYKLFGKSIRKPLQG